MPQSNLTIDNVLVLSEGTGSWAWVLAPQGLEALASSLLSAPDLGFLTKLFTGQDRKVSFPQIKAVSICHDGLETMTPLLDQMVLVQDMSVYYDTSWVDNQVNDIGLRFYSLPETDESAYDGMVTYTDSKFAELVLRVLRKQNRTTVAILVCSSGNCYRDVRTTCRRLGMKEYQRGRVTVR